MRFAHGAAATYRTDELISDIDHIYKNPHAMGGGRGGGWGAFSFSFSSTSASLRGQRLRFVCLNHARATCSLTPKERQSSIRPPALPMPRARGRVV